MGRLAVIGWDGATWDLMDPWIKDGYLPNIARLIENGVRSPLSSTVPPLSAPAWASFLTGKYPNKHGIYSFETRLPEQYTAVPANGSHIRSETISEIASRHGQRVIQVNVPMTYPPRAINGIWVSGLDAPSEDVVFTYPEALGRNLVDRYGYIVEASTECSPGREQALLNEVTEAEERRARAALDLFKNEPWDLYMVVFRGTDILAHHFWRFMDKEHPRFDPELAKVFGSVLLDHYQYMDELLGQFWRALPDDTTLIVASDHGFGPHLRWIYLNQIFVDLGLIQLRDPGKVNTKKNTMLKVQNSILGDILRKVMPLELRKSLGTGADAVQYDTIDWARSVLYPVNGLGLVRLNVKGRDPQGCVEPGAEYEALLDEIAGQVRRLRDPDTNRPIVKRTRRWNEIYPEPAEDSPDLWIEWETGYGVKRTTIAKSPFSEYIQYPSGNHLENGIFVASGAGIQERLVGQDAHLVDLAPTILHLLGLAIPDDMDGRVLMDFLSEDRRTPVVYEEALSYAAQNHAFSDEEQELLIKRLEGLGYL